MKDDIKELFVMNIDSDLRADAKSAVCTMMDEVRVEIPFRPGMFVAVATDEKIHAIDFFTEKGVRYVIGPLLRS